MAVACVIPALVPAGCDGETVDATRWVTVAELENSPVGGSGITSLPIPFFEFTRAPCRLRWENENRAPLRVYLVPLEDSTNRQLLVENPYAYN